MPDALSLEQQALDACRAWRDADPENRFVLLLMNDKTQKPSLIVNRGFGDVATGYFASILGAVCGMTGTRAKNATLMRAAEILLGGGDE